MVHPDLVKRAIIEFLQNDATLVAALGGKKFIKEADYQGQDFGYPHVRVAMLPQYPDGNGTSRTKLSQINWIVEVESEKPASQEADNILGLAIDAIFNKQWTGTNNSGAPYFFIIRVNLIHTQDAIRTPMRIWVATATFQAQITPLSTS